MEKNIIYLNKVDNTFDKRISKFKYKLFKKKINDENISVGGKMILVHV